jgi:hypothetical protein
VCVILASVMLQYLVTDRNDLTNNFGNLAAHAHVQDPVGRDAEGCEPLMHC